MDYDIYQKDVDNVFHQLRGHYLKINIDSHYEFPTFKKPEKEKKKVESPIPDRKPMQVSILEARMQKLQYIRLRRKGGVLEENDEQKNLQTANSSGYYSLDDLWTKLNANDNTGSNEQKMKTWRQLDFEEKILKLKEFANKFREEMDLEVWKEMKKDLYKNLKDGNFDNNTVINWHKGTQKILEINGLVINPACFYWN